MRRVAAWVLVLAWALPALAQFMPPGSRARSGVMRQMRVYIPAAGCVNTTAGSNWDTHATGPLAACVAGTIVNKGVLVFDNTNTCVTTTATVGCAQQTLKLPLGWAGAVDARIFFTTPTTTAAQTDIWTVATKCVTPVPTATATGTADNPAAYSTVQTVTYALGSTGETITASIVRIATLSNVYMAGCLPGDLWHVRIGRDVADTDTSAAVNLIGVEFTLRRVR